jgi:hypothetical protein
MKRFITLSLVILALSLAAFAQSTTLTCIGPTEYNGSREVKVVFDEVAGTASWNENPSSTATFTDREISWQSVNGDTDFNLSRMTGVLRSSAECSDRGCLVSRTVTHWQCDATQKKF